MAIGVIHGLGDGIGIIKQEIITNNKRYNILYTEYSNGYVTMDAKGYESVYATNSQVTAYFDFPNNVKLDKTSYCVTASFGSNGNLVRYFYVMADAQGNKKLDDSGFNYSWQSTSKYRTEFIFHIAGIKKI